MPVGFFFVFRFWFFVFGLKEEMAEVRKSRSYKDLEVWQVSLELVKAIYQITGKFPSAQRDLG